jgi:hypothetical protein
MTREEILDRNRLSDYLRSRGIKLYGRGTQLSTNVCPQTEHRPHHNCVSVKLGEEVFRCNDCGIGGSIIDWLMLETGQSAADVLKSLDTDFAATSTRPKPKNDSNGPTGSAPATPEVTATYNYTSESGELLYQVLRYHPKGFKQRHPDGKGGWVWSMEGISRVLFNLPKVSMTQEVFLVEGEKDCLTLEGLGFTATTSPGGSKNWLSGYADFLKGKDVVVIPDNDLEGTNYAKEAIKSISLTANSVKYLILPLPHKDTTNYITSFHDKAEATLKFKELLAQTPYSLKPIPIYTMLELEKRYRAFVRDLPHRSLDLSKFLAPLGNYTRPLIPGELMLILADTGVGKTVLCQNIARAATPLPTIFFELELPPELM